MAYVLGYIYADGSLDDSSYMRGKYIQITSTDEDSIQRIKNWLSSEHKINKKRSNFIGGKICFVLRIGSHKIYNDLFRLGLYPNKSLTVNFPKVPRKYLGHFIRGYFDGDGCVHFARSKGKTGKLIIKRVRVIFTSGSKVFLENMNKILMVAGIEEGKIYSSKRSYQAIYNTKDSMKIFKLIYRDASINSFFMRKFRVFNNYFILQSKVIDITISKIIDFHIGGHVVK